MKNLRKQSLHEYMSKQVSGLGLGLFRITFFGILFFEVVELFSFRNIFFQEQSFTYALGLLAWGAALLGMVVGLNTRVASWVNFILTVIIVGHFKD